MSLEEAIDTAFDLFEHIVDHPEEDHLYKGKVMKIDLNAMIAAITPENLNIDREWINMTEEDQPPEENTDPTPRSR